YAILGAPTATWMAISPTASCKTPLRRFGTRCAPAISADAGAATSSSSWHRTPRARRREDWRIASRISKRARTARLTATASVGVATLDRDLVGQLTIGALVEEADRALYVAKDLALQRMTPAEA